MRTTGVLDAAARRETQQGKRKTRAGAAIGTACPLQGIRFADDEAYFIPRETGLHGQLANALARFVA